MTMTQPEELKTVTAQIEDAYNRLLSSNAELARCKTQLESAEYAVSELQALKIDINDSIKTLTILKEKLEKDVEDRRKEKDKVDEEILAANKDLKEITKKAKAKTEELELREKNIETLSVELESKDVSLSGREVLAEEAERAIEEKHKAIKQLVANLK